MEPHRPSRRTVLGATGLVSLGALLSACSSGGSSDASGNAPAEDLLEKIQRAGEVRIGMEGTFRPYGYHDSSGALVGFEKEIGDLVARDLGVRATYVETQWDSLIAGVGAGRYDLVMNNIAPTAERKKSFDFSIPYAVSQGRVGVAKDSPLRSVDEIAGHSAAQTETSNFGQSMAKAGAQLVPSTGFDEAVMLVAFGRVDMTGNDFVTFQSFFEQRPDAGIRLLEGQLGDPSESAVLMARNQPRLRAAVDKSLTRHMDNGDLKKIYEKYVSTDLTPES
ncbi:amino acid ABC transporter substrate-binding protein [Kocuria sp.]|uniref:amino acid ABC transporter substrate-binding protein n=1 Tax=Kocuria sp. TaxID=1871328 RepID=UPI0026DA9139|nr:amino acid ABC transporter substrate-binding protein [Kocuria sp.]MDO4917975.1 amino acid ABC transporter substrate-binding protein [Kocuria sp.]